MRKILLGAVLMLVVVFCFRYCEFRKEEKEQLTRESALIEKALQNVGKLVVTEGEYAEIFTYKDSKAFYFDILSAKKEALVIVNAKASVSYDLHKIETQIDPASKTIYIITIPEPELTIQPDIEYYDIQQDLFNPFEAEDYNIIKERVTEGLQKKIQGSTLYTNAENRLISELHKLYVLTNSLGWSLEYNNSKIGEIEKFEPIFQD